MAETNPDFRMYRCGMCGFVYHERDGLPEEGYAPGTRWEEIPEGWSCPDCSASKADFEPGCAFNRRARDRAAAQGARRSISGPARRDN